MSEHSSDPLEIPLSATELLAQRNYSLLTDKTDNVELRSEILEHVFINAGETTNGKISLDSIARATNLLDLGMGRGSIGELAKRINPSIKVTGVDLFEYKGANAY